ncbi:MAG: glycosyltransferase [Saprospiraceae bacterium]|nr:glycosyltransferase [Saprospiraceae bacterium]
MKNIDITLLIPAFNPPAGWHHVFIERYLDFCDMFGAEIPVVLINDGSTRDIRGEADLIALQLGQKFKYTGYQYNKGKGGALKFGASMCETDRIVFTDTDFPYDNQSMKSVIKSVQSTSGLVTGFRSEAYYADVSLFRTILSKSLRWLNKSLLGLPVNDTQCGLKAFDGQVKAILLKCETDRFLIDLELLLAASNQNIKITPVPVKLRDDIGFTRCNASVLLKEVFSFFKLIWKYRVLKKKF